MEELFLRVPDEGDEAAVMEYRAEYLAHGDEPNGMSNLGGVERYADFLAHFRAYARKECCPPGFVPGTQYLAVRESDGRVVGMLNFRHELNPRLLETGGHAGYSVRPSERGRGYAAQMVELLKPIARQMGIPRLLITCDRENLASARTIQKAGGVLEDERWDDADGRWTQRYWVQL